jgi:beta-ribofuranosylaminobenzene 5'-phosphate synthase
MIITAYPRLHITLIGMNQGGYRINGGIGFTIEQPNLRLKITQSPDFQVLDTRERPLSEDGIHRLVSTIENVMALYKFRSNIKIEISGDVKTHFGFGTGTAIRLASLEGLFIVNNQEYTPTLLRKLSGRGGTSGIGIHTYFHGGLVFDLGHRPNLQRFKPSGFVEDLKETPLLLQQFEMPEWNIGICIPQDTKPKSELEEKKLFETTCPIPTEEAYKTLYHVTFGLCSAVLENDMDTFCKALISIQSCAWKLAERGLYGTELLDIEKALYQSGVSAVGLSSLGPCLYFFGREIEKIKSSMQKKRMRCELLITRPINNGRLIENA